MGVVKRVRWGSPYHGQSSVAWSIEYPIHVHENIGQYWRPGNAGYMISLKICIFWNSLNLEVLLVDLGPHGRLRLLSPPVPGVVLTGLSRKHRRQNTSDWCPEKSSQERLTTFRACLSSHSMTFWNCQYLFNSMSMVALFKFLLCSLLEAAQVRPWRNNVKRLMHWRWLECALHAYLNR